MSYSNGLLPTLPTSSQQQQRGPPGVGFALTDDGNYDIKNKKLTNVDEGVDNYDVINKHQMETELAECLKTNGSNQMLGNLNMGDRKITDLADGQNLEDAANMNNLNVGLSVKPNINTVILRDGTQSMTSNLNLGNNKIIGLQSGSTSDSAVTKQYIDNKTANFLDKKVGGVILGPISMNRNELFGIPTNPRFGYSAINRTYVNSNFFPY